MKVRVPAGIISESLDGYDNSRNTGFLAKDEFEIFRQAFGCALAELAQQLTIIQKELSQYFGNGENILPMRYGIKDSLFEMMTKLNHFFVIVGWTEPAATATVCQDELMMAIWTFDAGKSLMKITTIKILSHHMRYYRAVKGEFLACEEKQCANYLSGICLGLYFLIASIVEFEE